VANMAGWDTDCNVGNVGCIMGLVAGLAGIHNAGTDWFSDVNDHVLASLILGSECILDVPNAALMVSNLGRAVAGVEERQSYKGEALYHWSFPGSTHCWEFERSPGTAAVRETENATYGPGAGGRHTAQGRRGLKVIMHHLCGENEGVVYRKTFFTGDDITRSGYDIGTSPILYPGQTVRVTLYLSLGEGVTARLFVREHRSGERHDGPEVALPAGEMTELVFPIELPEAGLIDRVGIAFSAKDPATAVAYLDRVDWSGAPSCAFDLAGPEPMLGWGYLRGRWFGRAGGLNGSHYGKDAEAYTGSQAWQDYRYEVQLCPHCGQRHRILFRVQGAQRSYAFGLAPGGKVAFEKKGHRLGWGQPAPTGYETVASAPFPWELQRTHALAVEVEGSRMSGFVDGEQVLQWEDTDSPWEAGCVGLGLVNGRTVFTRAMLRPIE